MFKIIYSLLILCFTCSHAFAENYSCNEQEEFSVCSVDGGMLSEQETYNISKADSLSNEPIYQDIHQGKIYLYFFYAYDCPHCKKAHEVLEKLKRDHPDLIVKQYEVKKDSANAKYFEKVASVFNGSPKGVPTIYIGSKSFTGFYENVTCKSIIKEIKHLKGEEHDCERREIDIPMIGTISVDTISLPSFTIYIGLLDGINPCAMWVLMFLLGLMVYAQDRKKVIMLGTIFVATSGLVYFAFMSAWLNLFWIIGLSTTVTLILGIIAIVMGLINIKELFFFKKGISLMIPEKAKPKLYKKARQVINEQNSKLAIAGTVLLAIFVNFIELGCTIGLPAIYTRILSVRDLSAIKSYMYMALYNIAYVVPLAVIVTLFAYTMGHYKFTEKHGKIFKLISGFLMLALGSLLAFYPELLVFT